MRFLFEASKSFLVIGNSKIFSALIFWSLQQAILSMTDANLPDNYKSVEQMTNEMFDKMDENGDDFISKDEFTSGARSNSFLVDLLECDPDGGQCGWPHTFWNCLRIVVFHVNLTIFNWILCGCLDVLNIWTHKPLVRNTWPYWVTHFGLISGRSFDSEGEGACKFCRDRLFIYSAGLAGKLISMYTKYRIFIFNRNKILCSLCGIWEQLF